LKPRRRPSRPGLAAPLALARAEWRRRERRGDLLATIGLAALVLLVLGWVPA
jgi:hypothetical protein